MKKLNNFGFTLLEVMITIAIIGGLFAITSSLFKNNNQQIRGELRKLSTVIKKTRTHAQLFNSPYRLVIDLGQEEFDDGTEKEKMIQSYWVEKGSGQVVISNLTREERLEKEQKDREEGRTPTEEFAQAKKITKKKIPLSHSLKFKSIEMAGEDKEIQYGLVYLYFIPQGWNHEAVIHMGYKDKSSWSLYIHPITGKATLLNKKTTLKQINEG